MCGIAGFFNLTCSNFSVDEKLLDCMQKTLFHRGPDCSGIWKSDLHQLGLAHRRLSIIDLSDAGRQPMQDKEKTIVICFNGEIYNHKKLRIQLQGLGYKYFSESDTETLIYAYKEWGIDFLHKLDGMFSIVLFDIKKNQLFLIRDRIGIKPLYFSTQNGVLSFASEIKALWCLPWINKKLSEQSLYHYLTFMVVPAPGTIFQNISKLPAGCYLKVDDKKKISFTEWYNPIKNLSSAEKKELKNENYCLEKIEDLLKNAVKKRMMSDVPIGAFLSGGVDSSLIVALMSQFGSKVKTFTISFSDGPEFDELQWARKVAKRFDTQHHEITVSEKQAYQFYSKMIYHLDEPLADCVCIPFYYISKLAKDNGVTVVQVGEGADELFFGYNGYVSYKKFYDTYWNTTKFVPTFLKKTLYKFSKKVLPKKVSHLEILKNWAYNNNLFWGGAIAFNEHQKKMIFNKNFNIQNYDSFYVVDKNVSKLKKLDPYADFVKQITYLELKNRLPELLLMRADKMSMAASVEARVPFLDHTLVEFMLNVPSSFKFKNRITKYLLKKVAEKYLPKEIVYRKKVGFAAPTQRWFSINGQFNKYFDNLLKNKEQTNLFLPAISNLEKTYNYHQSGFAVQKWVIQNFLSHRKIFEY